MNPLDPAAERLAAQHQDHTGDEPSFFGPLQPGDDLESTAMLNQGSPQTLGARLGGCHQLLYFVRGDGLLDDEERRMLHALLRARTPVLPLLITRGGLKIAGFESLVDVEGELARRCDARAGTSYLLDPQARVLARWRRLNLDEVGKAMAGTTEG
jgi:3-(3-hydroxy-phenyl)propionate hydroxylase